MKERLLRRRRIAESGCWEWRGARMPKGYGVIKCGHKTRTVHRVAFECFRGKIPPKKLVCHTCANPRCFNPEHLYLGDHRQNFEDAVKDGAFHGERGAAGRLNEMQVRIIRRLYPLGGWSHREIGELFGVGLSAICSVIKRRTWKHI